MSKLRRSCRLSLSIVAGALVLVAAAPASALAEEPVAEPPSSEAAPPPSTGWVPQDPGTEPSGAAAAPTQHGSSLGSGGVSHPSQSSAEAPSETSGSSGSYEPESPSPSTYEGPTRTPPVPNTSGSVEPPPAPSATPARVGTAALGDSIPVALPEPANGADTSAALPAKPAALTTGSAHVSSGYGATAWLVLIVCGLIGVFAAWRLGIPAERTLTGNRRASPTRRRSWPYRRRL